MSEAATRPSAPVLRAEDVVRTFSDGQRTLKVLRGASMTLRPGEVVALVGRSGSGKSTLLHILGMLDTCNAGEVLVDETPTATLTEGRRAEIRNRMIGFVFQHYHLLPEFNVLENVLMSARVAHPGVDWLSRRGGHRARAAELLERVGLKEQAGQRPATLSGGERQRAALARALVLNPRVLLCDEPTGNLDPETGGRIMNLIFELCRRDEVAALVVTHDQALTERADRVLRLEAGRLHPKE
jgi:lipoprotein-releasing system ATP-binding protein